MLNFFRLRDGLSISGYFNGGDKSIVASASIGNDENVACDLLNIDHARVLIIKFELCELLDRGSVASNGERTNVTKALVA